jgi:hypothetical protein
MEVKNIVLLVIFILGIVFVQFTQAQSVDDIISKYIDARGGKDKLNAIQSLYMEGSRHIMGNEIGVKVSAVQGKLYRTDFEYGANNGYTIITPTEGWNYFPMRSQKAEPIVGDILKNMQGQLDINGPLIGYSSKGHKAELQGKETIDGKEAHKIKLTLNTGREITYFIDTKTNLLIQSRQMAGTRGNTPPQEVITNYSDYKPFEGLLFPLTIANPGTAMTAGATTYNTIVVNKPIEESTYKPSK